MIPSPSPLPSSLTLLITLLTLLFTLTPTVNATCSRNATAAASTCSVAGTSLPQPTGYRAYRPVPATSFTQCRDFVTQFDTFGGPKPGQPHQFNNVSAFNFNASSGLCSFRRQSLAEIDFKPQVGSPAIYASTECYVCEKVCPPVDADNHVYNGGFDLSNTTVQPWKIDHFHRDFSLVSPGYAGSANALSTTKNEWSLQNTPLGICSGAIYKLTFAYRAAYSANSTGSASLEIMVRGFTFYTNAIVDKSQKGWVTFTDYVSLTPFGTRRPTLSIAYDNRKDKSPQRFLLDQVSMVPDAGPFTTKPGAVEQLSNGGFENGKLAPWYRGAHVAIVSPGITGKYAASSTFQMNLAHNVSLTLGTTYLLSFSYKAVYASPDNYFSLEVGFYPAGSNINNVDEAVSGYYGVQTQATSGRYVQPVVARIADGAILITVTGGEPTRNFTIDDVSLKELA